MVEIERMAALCMKDLDDEEGGDEDLDDDDDEDLMVPDMSCTFIYSHVLFFIYSVNAEKLLKNQRLYLNFNVGIDTYSFSLASWQRLSFYFSLGSLNGMLCIYSLLIK